MSVPRVYLPACQGAGGPATLPADEAHHLTHVLRLGVGADVTVFDGAGREWRARVTAVNRRAVTVDVGEEVVAIREPVVSVTLGDRAAQGRPDGRRRSRCHGAWRRRHRAGALGARRGARTSVAQRDGTQSLAARRRGGGPTVRGGPSCQPSRRWRRSRQCSTACTELDSISASSPPAPGRTLRTAGRPVQALVLVGPEGGW